MKSSLLPRSEIHVPSPIMKQRIVDELTEEIRNGRLAPGDQLPTTPELRARFDNTSIVTVRAAVALLKAAGLIEFIPGAGLFVKERPAVR